MIRIREDLAMVVGGADCVWDDVNGLLCMTEKRWPGLVIVVNDMAIHWPFRADHWVTLHVDKLPAWRRAREQRARPGKAETWGRHSCDHHVQDWPHVSSGGLGIQVALEKLGCAKVVLCGIPLTPTPHFAQSTEAHLVDAAGQWDERQVKHHLNGLELVAGQIEGKVRSMSGWTRERFGAPTPDWLTQAHS